MVEERTAGVYRIHVYDNNYPGAEKYAEVDTNANRWMYAGAALNPNEDPAPWEGGVGTMDITLLWRRYEPLVCPFCGDHAPPKKPRPAKAPELPKKPSVTPDEISISTPIRCSKLRVVTKKDKKELSTKKREIPKASMTSLRGS